MTLSLALLTLRSKIQHRRHATGVIIGSVKNSPSFTANMVVVSTYNDIPIQSACELTHHIGACQRLLFTNRRKRLTVIL